MKTLITVKNQTIEVYGGGPQGPAGPVGPMGPPGGSSNVEALADLSDCDTTTFPPITDEVLKWNGLKWVPAVYNQSFAFSVLNFSGNAAGSFLLGSGIWKSAGALSFSAAYNNGPADSAYVSFPAWSSNLTLTGATGPNASTENVIFPNAIGTLTFTLHALKGAVSASQTLSASFLNTVRWGKTAKTSGFTSVDIAGLSYSLLSNSRYGSYTVTTGAGEHICFSTPSRLGVAVFTVGGFTGGFSSPEFVSYTNALGYNEEYAVYASTNTNLGSVTFVVS